MNNKKWLVRVASLTATLALSLSFGLAACTPGVTPGPDDGEHTHSYTQWAHDGTQHWKVCPDDNTADESTKANHSFVEGACECGATEGTVDVPDENLDTREFYVVGGGMGDLKDATWNTCAAQYKFTKAEKADANGNTVYTYQLKLYSGDEFKFIQPTTITKGKDADGNDTEVWDDSSVLSFADFAADAVKDIFKEVNGNITVEVGADGIYEFTIRTTKDGDIHANKVEVKLIEKLDSMGVLAQYDMYVVGTVASKPTCGWPSLVGVANVPSRCIHMELQEDGETFSVEVILGTSDAFKVWNYKLGNANAGYYPTGVGGDLKVTTAGAYVVSWKVGDNNVSVKAHEHSYTEWGKNDTQHWKYCAKDNVIDENSRANHSFNEENVCECGAITTASCKHENGASFPYTADTVPTPEEEGGSLEKLCPDCGAVVETVAYKKGLIGNSKSTTYINELDGAGIYYHKTRDDGGEYMGFQMTKAGTYTLSFTEVFKDADSTLYLAGLWVDSGAYVTAPTKSRAVISACAWSYNDTQLAKVEKYNITIDKFEEGVYHTLKSISLTVSEEDVAEGAIYVRVYVACNRGLNTPNPEHNATFLAELSVQETVAAAPAEVALLPKKED